MKKLASLLIVLILIVVIITAYYKKRISQNLPSSFKDKIAKAHEDIILFKYKDADTLYSSAIKQKKNDAIMEEYLAFLISQENLNEAKHVADKILDYNPNHLLANLVVAAYYVKNNQLEKAINLIKASAVNINSFNNSVYAILSIINFFIENQTNNFNELSSQIKTQLPDFYYNQYILYNLLVKDYNVAKTVAAITVSKYPNIDNIITYAKLSYKSNPSEGIKIFKEYLNDNFLTNKSIASYLDTSNGINNVTLSYVFSDALYRLSKYSSNKIKIAYIQPDNMLINHIALMLNPSNTLARIQNASYYTQLGDYSLAMENFSHINKNGFYYRLIYPEILKDLTQLNKTKEAINLLNNVYKKDETNPQPLLELGHLYEKQQNYTNAINYYSKALNVSTQNKQELGIWLAYYFRGIAYNNNNQWNLAEQDLLNALKINNKDPLLLNYIGYSWIDKGYNINKAFNMITKALKEEPLNPNFLDSYAWALYKKKDFKQALTEILAAKKLAPFNETIIDHLGDIYLALGIKQKALDSWNSVLNISHNNALIARVNNKIKKVKDEIS